MTLDAGKQMEAFYRLLNSHDGPITGLKPESEIRKLFPEFKDEPYILWIEFALRIRAYAWKNKIRLEAEDPVEYVACRHIAYRVGWRGIDRFVIRASVGPGDVRETMMFLEVS